MIFFGVRWSSVTPNEHQSSIFTSGEATSENTTFGVHEQNKIQSFT